MQAPQRDPFMMGIQVGASWVALRRLTAGALGFLGRMPHLPLVRFALSLFWQVVASYIEVKEACHLSLMM